MNAFMNSVGLETLGLRMERCCHNALKLAEFFESCDGIEVNYPALKASPFYDLCQEELGGKGGAILTIRAGSKERAFKLINGLKLATNATNIGDTKNAGHTPCKYDLRSRKRGAEDKRRCVRRHN